ncbi:MAG: HU family DNA-binding protein, partial [Prevotella sp.]|nr:HU family DNA-binding protein [Prevotella sp.]
MGKLTIQEIAKVLVEKNGLEQRAANKFATEMFAVILHRLEQGEQVKVKGLGVFKIISVE